MSDLDQTGELLFNEPVHEGLIEDLQWSADRTYLITASADKSAKVSG